MAQPAILPQSIANARAITQIRGNGVKSVRRVIDASPGIVDRSSNPSKLQRKKERERLRRSVLKEKMETLRRLIQPFIPNGQAMERAFILTETAKLLSALLRQNSELKLRQPHQTFELMPPTSGLNMPKDLPLMPPPPLPTPTALPSPIPAPTLTPSIPQMPQDQKAAHGFIYQQLQEHQKVINTLKSQITLLQVQLTEKAETIRKMKDSTVGQVVGGKKRRTTPTKKKRGMSDQGQESLERAQNGKKRKRPASSISSDPPAVNTEHPTAQLSIGKPAAQKDGQPSKKAAVGNVRPVPAQAQQKTRGRPTGNTMMPKVQSGAYLSTAEESKERGVKTEANKTGNVSTQQRKFADPLQSLLDASDKLNKIKQ
eukprot:CAMPEP_0167755262 /NCGR_PEP_ID=MMETSP0110_2-20121227/8725_1 /TAXON_ID=629695 /ORGANISM="Gymnochlora sp., Strain CCMP2014" /LENGTH=370 /DNA_ID=CAMNT_0007641227 /DNA_START=133 /DNA_END=1245 /DNA_ORIENTATION=+